MTNYMFLRGPSAPNPDFAPPPQWWRSALQYLYLFVGAPDAESGFWLLCRDKDTVFGLLNRTVVWLVLKKVKDIRLFLKKGQQKSLSITMLWARPRQSFSKIDTGDFDSNSNPLRPNMRQSKKNNMMQPFSWFCFRLNPTSDTAMRHPLVLTADTAGRVYHWFILMWSVWQSEFIGNHNMIAMALKLSRLLFTRRISIPEWRSNLFYTLPLSLSSHRSML